MGRYTQKHRKAAPKGTDLGLTGGGPGKGSVPRNCFSPEFRENYDRIFRKPKRILK